MLTNQSYTHFPCSPILNLTQSMSSNGQKYFFKQDRAFTLEIATAQDEDAGRYFCQGKNAVGTGAKSEAIQVLVVDPPVFTLKPQDEYWVEEGTRIRIPCKAGGDPWPITSLVRKVSLSCHLVTTSK